MYYFVLLNSYVSAKIVQYSQRNAQRIRKFKFQLAIRQFIVVTIQIRIIHISYTTCISIFKINFEEGVGDSFIHKKLRLMKCFNFLYIIVLHNNFFFFFHFVFLLVCYMSRTFVNMHSNLHNFLIFFYD